MKRLPLACLLVAALPVLAHATSYTFTDGSATYTNEYNPTTHRYSEVQTGGGDGTSSSFSSLAHGTAYTWGFTNASAGGGTNLSGLEAAIHTGTTDITSASITITGISDWTKESSDVLYVDLLNGLLPGAKSDTYISSPVTDDTFYGGDPFNPNSKLAYYNSTTNKYINNNANNKTATSGYGTYNSVLTKTTAYKNGTFKFDSAGSANLIQGNVYTSAGKTNTLSPGTFTADNTTNTFSITINLSAANIGVLESYLAADYNVTGSTLGLGFGPDCHFSDTGISLSITTGVCRQGGGGGGGGGGSGVPDAGSTAALLGIGLLTVGAARRRLFSGA